MLKKFLERCQVATPSPIVRLTWEIASKCRSNQPFSRVLDLGAGDGRFALGGHYTEYLGLELDPAKIPVGSLPAGARVDVCDAMALVDHDFDLCIGNPPYVRHHHHNRRWRQNALRKFEIEAGVRLKETANAFVLFLLQALLRTSKSGLVVQVVPFEWVTRPSAAELRSFIQKRRWNVTVYRFKEDVFPRVLTTASITVIDKQTSGGKWEFGELDADGAVTPLAHASGRDAVLPYVARPNNIYSLRGLSPGGQDIFVLTEAQRMFFGLKIGRDVRRCVTSLRQLPSDVTTLDGKTFRQHFVEQGRRCWLVRSDKEHISDELRSYLRCVGSRWQAYSTCRERKVWWRYRPHPAPTLLVSSGFVGGSTKVVVNKVNAVAVGAVYGVFADCSLSAERVGNVLRAFEFEKRIVSHSNNLKKLEVNQLNAVLSEVASSV